MQRSSSSFFDDLDNFSSLSGSGADLTRYQEQLARERNSRTLNLRHSNRITIAGMLQRQGHNSFTKMSLNNPLAIPFLNQKQIIDEIKSGNISQIGQIIQNIESVVQKSPKLLKDIFTSDFYEFLCEAFLSDNSELMQVQLCRLLALVFPHSDPYQDQISEQIGFAFYALFDSTSPDLLFATVQLVSSMANSSITARDSFISFGICQSLVDLAQSQRSVELTRAACHTLYCLFGTTQAIDNELLIENVPALFGLLALDDKQSICHIIECFVGMANKYSQLVFTLHGIGLYSSSVEMLKDPELIGPTLHLIGNLSVAEPRHIKDLIEAGVLPILTQLLLTEYVADTFWVLSNLLERTKEDILPFCTPEFISQVIDIIKSSNIHTQTEGSFFLSTVILLSSNEALPSFMNPVIIEILVSMLDCGMHLVVLRCIDTFLKFFRFTLLNPENCAQFLSDLSDSDIKERLEELVQEEDGLITEKACYAASLLEQIGSSIGS